MKNVIITAIVLALAASSCKKEDSPAINNTPQTGRATFWYNSYGTNATVRIGTYTGYVTSYYSGYDPACGASGCANFILSPGTYYYTAESTWSYWSGNVVVYNNGCTKILLQ